ncbi:endocuticle structural glycoprotein SgAbd-2 [Halyomorpha halys]|uniref:endocuticle structural glycoprotein SgAbd-2 n=1 Tax=Halyomorpha halys TaxID=286706 RepID=UPI0006D4E4C6|nr:endocuticle structural glycoprotein SgAbd-2 [Halyomorpha halys]KAE8573246.1 Cuticle Protein CPR RR-1 [Halyomorpha halys]
MITFTLAVLAVVGSALSAPQYSTQNQQLRLRPYNQPAPIAPAPPAPVAPLAPRQASGEAFARILKNDQETQFDGNFNYAYETENGISGQAQGTLKNPGTQDEAQVITGSYSYTAPDGTPVRINFIADEGGFRAEGDAIPTPPPIPVEIARALDYIRSLPPQPQQPQYQ